MSKSAIVTGSPCQKNKGDQDDSAHCSIIGQVTHVEVMTPGSELHLVTPRTDGRGGVISADSRKALTAQLF
jgi:hypothetical protein